MVRTLSVKVIRCFPQGPTAARQNPPVALALILAAGLFLSGCTARVHQSVASYMSSLGVPQPAFHAGPLPGTTEGAAPPVFTFVQACDRAAKFDAEVSGALAEAAQLQIDLEQAHSSIWPRLDLRTYFQIPLGGTNLQYVRTFNGGLFFRYDLQTAVFSSDASAVARTKIEAKRENIMLALQRLSHDLFLLLADREAARAEVVVRRDVQARASEVLDRVHLLEQTGRINPDRVFEYQYQYETSTRLHQEAVRRLAEINRALADRLAIDGNQELVITDLSELLASLDEVVPTAAPNDSFLREVWSRRHDAKLAEAELFLKEMGVIAERRRRIPNISASFGLGSLSLSSTFSQPPFVVQLGASMPLLDFGDIKREVNKATIERDLARRNINLLLLQTRRDVENTSAVLSDAIARRKAAADHWDLIVQQDVTNQKLVSLGLVDPIDLLVFRMREGDAQIELKRAQINVSKAAAEYSRASGLDLGPGSGDPVPGKGR